MYNACERKFIKSVVEREEEWKGDEHDQNILYACIKFAKINEMLYFVNVIN